MVKRKIWKPKQVEVEWIDAVDRTTLHGTLGAVLDKAKLVQRLTGGYLLKCDEFLTVLAHDYDPPEETDEEPEVGNITIIPSGWVIHVKHKGRVIITSPAVTFSKPDVKTEEAPS